jgi:AcrR family transcriptional regulator
VRTNKLAARRTQVERSAESAQRLLDAAIELIADKGFERTTAAEIGERAGYSRSMVRARYGSKEALLQSIFGEELDKRLLPVVDDSASGGEWVLARVDDVIRLLDEEPELMRAFCVMSFEAAVAIDSLRVWYRDWFGRYERALAAHLRAGIADGSVRAGIDPDAEATQFVLTGIGLIFRWTLDPLGYDLASEFSRWRARLQSEFQPRAR